MVMDAEVSGDPAGHDDYPASVVAEQAGNMLDALRQGQDQNAALEAVISGSHQHCKRPV